MDANAILLTTSNLRQVLMRANAAHICCDLSIRFALLVRVDQVHLEQRERGVIGSVWWFAHSEYVSQM